MQSGVGPFARFEDHGEPYHCMESSSVVQGTFNATCKRSSGLVSIPQNGDFVFAPKDSGGTCFSRGSKAIQIPHEEVVGVLKTGPYTFHVWHCPVVSSKGGEVKRKLIKSPEFTLLQGGAAEQAGGAARALDSLVAEVRQRCCWWGKKVPPRVTVVVNPVSGKGRSLKLVQEVVLPVLRDAAGMTVTVRHTQGPRNAEDIVAALDLGSNDLVVFAGGDGTAYEGLQGFFKRSDWEEAIKLPIAVIPTGSGNGLAASTGMWCPATASHAICKGFLSQLDIASAFQTPNQRHFIFLSVTYGLMSNLDEGTNHLRWMGELRFVYGMLRELLRGKSYKARIAYVPAHTSLPSTAQADDPSTTEEAEKEGTAETSEPGRLLSHYAPGPACPHLSQLGSLPSHVPVDPSSAPPGWQVLGQIGLQYFGVYSPNYIALDFKVNPQGGIASGHMDLQYLDGGSMGLGRRLQGLSAFIQSMSGVVAPIISTAKVSSLMIEPLDGGTWMELDGEVVRNQPLYLEVHPGLARVLVAPGLATQLPGTV